MSRARVLALLQLGGTVLFWGTSFVAIKIAYANFAPMAVMWLRMMIASVALAPFWRRIPRPQYVGGDWRFLMAAVMFIPCLYYTLESYALRHTSASQAGVVSALMPLVVAAGAWAVLREHLSWQAGVGIAVSIAGVAVLSVSGAAVESAPAPALGNALEVGAMCAAAGSTLTVKHLSTRYDPWFLTGLQAAVGTVFFAPFALASGWGELSASAVAAVVYLGLFPSLVAFGLYNSALGAMPASRASLAINLIPAVAMLSGWALLGEALSPVQLAACAVIVGAVVFAEVAGRAGVEEAVAP